MSGKACSATATNALSYVHYLLTEQGDIMIGKKNTKTMSFTITKKITLSVSVFCLICLNAYQVYSQELIRSYVTEKSIPINTIEPDSNNYSDLQPIGDAIGNDGVVMLGEQAHGDAPTFLAKTRLIKYLHEKKGFNVLAFESDFFGLNDGWERLNKTGPGITDFIIDNVYGVWTLCNTCSTLFFQYIPYTHKTSQPITLTGFDSQLLLSYSLKNLKVRLDSMLRSRNLPITEQPNYVSEILPLINASLQWPFEPPKKADGINTCLENLEIIKSQLKSLVNDDDFWLFVVDNLIHQVRKVKLLFDTGKEDINARDLQMAKNLKWLIENKYKGQKIIVWAASMHIAKSLKNIRDSLIKTEEPMGGHLVGGLPKEDQVYILGFSSYQGTAGRIGRDPYKVSTSNQNSFEGWLNAKDYKYAFVDFSKFNLLYPESKEYFFMAPLGHEIVEGIWNRVFDGMFFIRDMYACIPITHHP